MCRPTPGASQEPAVDTEVLLLRSGHSPCRGGSDSRSEPRPIRSGRYFEQWVGIEIWKRLQYRGEGQLHHYRTKDGAEVDFIVDVGNRVIPVEVKWTDKPSLRDVPNLVAFIKDHPLADTGYVVCRCPRPMKLSESVMAIPWDLL